MSNTDPKSFAPELATRVSGFFTFGKPSLTSSQAASNLIADSQWGMQGTALTISYAFRRDGDVPDTASSGFSRFSAQQMQIAGEALNAWAAVANIRFVRADDGDGYSNDATILFGNYLSGPNAGFAFLPGAKAVSSRDGDIWINAGVDLNLNPTRENYGFQVLLHEIGHAIGLTHPSDYNGNSDGALTYERDADYAEDTMRFTVMSYFTAYLGKPLPNTLYPAGPEIDDITAVQRLYGANLATSGTDTIYSSSGINSSIALGQKAVTNALWDGGGIDTIDLSDWTGDATLDLRAGALSFDGRLMIAEGTVIENAIGAQMGGTLIGNEAANVLRGNGFSGRLYGEGGDDVLIGGVGNDILDGGSGTNRIDGRAGEDTLLLRGVIGDYSTVLQADGNYRISGNGIINFVRNVEIVNIFADGILYPIRNSFAEFFNITVERSTFGIFRNGRYSSPQDDFDGNGSTDLLIRGATGAVEVWRATGKIGLADIFAGASADYSLLGKTVATLSMAQQNSALSLAPGWRVVGSIDMDGDHRSDLLLVNDASRLIGIRNAVTGGFAASGYVNSPPASTSSLLATGDINGDGRGDMLWRDVSGALTAWFSTGYSFSEKRVAAPGLPGNASFNALRDVNGDGRADLVLGISGGVETWLRTDEGFAAAAAFAGQGSKDDRVVGVADFNGDDISDVLWLGTNGTASVWLGSATGYVQGAFETTTLGAGWTLAAIGDFSRDGLYDVLWRHDQGTAKISISTEKAFLTSSGNYFPYELLPSFSSGGGAANGPISIGSANGQLVGSGGKDTAVIYGTFAETSFVFTGGHVEIVSTAPSGGGYKTYVGTRGLDRLAGIERVQFSDGLVIDRADGSPLVDDLFYYATYRDVAASRGDADTHYTLFGWREGRDPNALFATAAYLGANKDVAAAKVNPLDHYALFGAREGRDPSAMFDNEQYLARNPDVAAAGINPLVHYLASGQAEGRAIYAAVGNKLLGDFDGEYYLLNNPDVAAAGVDPLAHYRQFGWREGRDPNAYFDTSYYLATNADVAASKMNPLDHYMQYGWREGRDPSVFFDTSYYLARNSDVAAAGVDPLYHYLTYGRLESRVIAEASALSPSGFDAMPYVDDIPLM